MIEWVLIIYRARLRTFSRLQHQRYRLISLSFTNSSSSKPLCNSYIWNTLWQYWIISFSQAWSQEMMSPRRLHLLPLISTSRTMPFITCPRQATKLGMQHLKRVRALQIKFKANQLEHWSWSKTMWADSSLSAMLQKRLARSRGVQCKSSTISQSKL